jgi:anthranilate synthase component I
LSSPAFNLTEEEFLRTRQRGNLVPLFREVGADLLTPVLAAMSLTGKSRYHFLLESVEGGESLARYTFLGIDPYCVLRGRGSQSLLEEQGRSRELPEDPLRALQRLASRYQSVHLPDLPRFSGGGVGYLSYDLVRLREKIPLSVRDDLGLPDLLFGFYDALLAFDHLRQRIQILVLVRTEEVRGTPRQQYREACRRILQMERALLGVGWRPKSQRRRWRGSRMSSTRPAAEFRRGVERAREAIAAGEIFQVVLSRRFQQRCLAPPFAIYRALRRLNPSPYLFCLGFPEMTLTGASPEMLVRVEGRRIQTRPIAGTRPRGKSEAEDRLQEETLKADPKERSEHLMLVDLGRNDLGRVCRYDSVRTTSFMEVERYSHVMHLASRVEGELRSEVKPLDALMACFPAGTVTGAPKVRAMELIDNLERLKRGPYAGAVGYLDFFGNLDTCITIRTALLKEQTAYLQAGAGVVADSTPEGEDRECLNKAQILFAALRQAEGMSG